MFFDQIVTDETPTIIIKTTGTPFTLISLLNSCYIVIIFALSFDRLRSLMRSSNSAWSNKIGFFYERFSSGSSPSEKPLIFYYTQAILCFRRMYKNRLGHGWEININNPLLILCIKALYEYGIREISIQIIILRSIPKYWCTKI